MLKIEYLVFIENQNIKSSNEKTFNYLLQSDPEITISKNRLSYKELHVNYLLESGKVKNTGESYFHLSIECDNDKRIEEFIELLRAVKSILHIINKTPQTLFDGISLYYSNLAYPQIFEVENLMRKLITKFMLTNVGINWIKDRVPDDVKNSIISSNKDMTYLHNVDFIQLKNFLFSENYTAHKDHLIQKLRKAQTIEELKLEEIKALIPMSNWEKFFSTNVDITKENLSKKWDELYGLRCKIAHNRTFEKSDYEKVNSLSIEVKDVISKAILNLDKINISEIESTILTETVAGNFNFGLGEYLSEYSEMTRLIYMLVENKIFNMFPEQKPNYSRRSIVGDLTRLSNHGLLNEDLHNEIRNFIYLRNKIVHEPETVKEENISAFTDRIKVVNKTLDGWL
ncbi:hypothetical protein G7A72_03195 [Flavobacterium sp. Sr18]|jgi:hypothetical protein|uniref:HEPN domain-containing protein n=1 Tax=Flavobacterium sp. Sr18 TaxID=935222 RepID=UPI0013E42960|nr:HEPN domain-containing protein [Flavobacterium sp. Sr18]QIH37866.1 hypothetical protein G7A72_03195 [Flavobacterium sp. Sr18]